MAITRHCGNMSVQKTPQNNDIDMSMNPRGSLWHRWDPHIHTPDTLLSNHFSGDNPWEDFIKLVEESTPTIAALGITDYYTVDAYEKVLEFKKSGRLPKVGLVFPNVELRLDIATSKDSGVNAHLLVSPEKPDHIDELKRFLNNLTFNIGADTFRCSNADLIRLGKFHDKAVKDDRKALETGANQFKVNFNQLQKEITGSAWAQSNILLCVSGNTNDGTSGLQNPDASFAALRVEIERCSHIIFASSANQRSFWLGHGAATKAELLSKWDGCKPCLHGSDAHKQETVGVPNLERYSWIKGDLTFESLRQVCIEPESRVIIGKEPPAGAVPSCVIQDVEVSNASWIETPKIQLNAGLVAVIGARGSGKTALADLIAAGGYSLLPQLNERSFIKRARSLIEEEEVTLNWESGRPSTNKISAVDIEDILDHPKVQYLSQQFVDQLCSAEGITDELMSEIERVIFQAHPSAERMGAANFQELLAIRSDTAREERKFHEQVIDDSSSELTLEREKRDNQPTIAKLLAEKKLVIENNKKDRQALVTKSDDKEKRQIEIATALDNVRAALEQASRKNQALAALKSEAANLKGTSLPNHLAKLKEKHAETGLTGEQWNNFQLCFVGDVDAVIDAEIAKGALAVNKIKGAKQADLATPPQTKSYLKDDIPLEEQGFNALTAELARLQALMGIDKVNSQKYIKLNDKIQKEEAELGKLQRALNASEQAKTRIEELRAQRKAAYQKVFEALLSEQKELITLYKPLMENLKGQSGTLGKLTFHVERTADIESWAERGEALLDLRKSGAFKGKGSLLEAAKNELQDAWETKTPDFVSQALAQFIEKHEKDFNEHAPVEKANKEEFRVWSGRLSEWLYSTAHISINYGVQYDEVSIQQLSPGTRGIVLLLLYLAVDKEDDRPLIIDQPEENLDPKSIYDELVSLFRLAKLRRQIIIVTHNANLVVNTDADQVIVATCGPHRTGQLPLINYQSGGLENPNIRKKVCEILEGGEVAFKERAKRLRVGLSNQ